MLLDNSTHIFWAHRLICLHSRCYYLCIKVAKLRSKRSSYLPETVNLETDGTKSCQMSACPLLEVQIAILHLCWLLVALKVAWPGYWPRTAQENAWQPSVGSPVWARLEPEPYHLPFSFQVITFHFLSSLKMTKHSSCCCSVPKSCPTLCHPMDCSMPGSSFLYYLSELLRYMYIESVMLSNILSSAIPSPCAFNIFQHQNLFQWVCFWHQMARVLELQFQRQSFQWIFRVDFLWDWLVWSLCCTRDSQESSPAPQFENIT